jgi:hypothetical protein
MINRNTYMTTHADIILHLFGDGEMQGSFLPSKASITLRGKIASKSTSLISSVELISNTGVITSWQPKKAEFDFKVSRSLNTTDYYTYFFTKVTLDNNHMAISSPIWVSQGGAVSGHVWLDQNGDGLEDGETIYSCNSPQTFPIISLYSIIDPFSPIKTSDVSSTYYFSVVESDVRHRLKIKKLLICGTKKHSTTKWRIKNSASRGGSTDVSEYCAQNSPATCADVGDTWVEGMLGHYWPVKVQSGETAQVYLGIK